MRRLLPLVAAVLLAGCGSGPRVGDAVTLADRSGGAVRAWVEDDGGDPPFLAYFPPGTRAEWLGSGYEFNGEMTRCDRVKVLEGPHEGLIAYPRPWSVRR